MRLILLVAALVLPGFRLFAQYVYTIKADSVKFTNCDSSEFILENHTQSVPGFLFNTGNGRTIFKRPLTRISDTLVLVGQDSLKLPNPNAWLQGGNSFGATGILGTLDDHNLDFYTYRRGQMRLDSTGELMINTTTSTFPYKLDVLGATRVAYTFDVGTGGTTSTDFIVRPYVTNYYGTGIDGGGITSIGGRGTLGSNLAPLGTIPANSLLIGAASPHLYDAIIDYGSNPIFIANYSDGTIINGGYNGIDSGGARGNGINANAPPFYINSGRGTGTGVQGDITFQTGSPGASSNTIHPMTMRWVIKGGTGNLSNNTSPTSTVDITGPNGYNQLRIRTQYTPTSSSDANGNKGDIAVDDNYLYYKTSTGWKRVALSAF